MLLDALQRTLYEPERKEQPESELPPRGGFTDVGLHTGGIRRNTSWPLVQAVFQVLLESSGNSLLYRTTMAYLQLKFAEREFFSGIQGISSIGRVMQMLSCAVRVGSLLVDEGHDMTAFEARCVLLRFKLDETANAQAVAYSKRFELPAVECSKGEAYRPFHLNLPVEIFPRCESDSLEAARLRVSGNLNSLPVFSMALCKWSELKSWIERYKGLLNRQDALLLVANTVETFTFMHAPELIGKATDSLESIEYIWDFYMTAVDAFRTSTSSKERQVLVTWKSKEVLVTWIFYCIVHMLV